MRKVWLAAAITVATLTASPAFAACDERPVFASSFDPAAIPDPPRNASTRPSIEAYRLTLETYRMEEIEGYNLALQSYVASPVTVDNEARALAAEGRCSVAEYAALRDHLDKEFAKSGDVYLAHYWKGLAEYRRQIAWCEQRTAQISGNDRRQTN